MKKLSDSEISAFCMEMSMLLSSGVSLELGILTMLEDEKTKEGKQLLSFIYNSIEQGVSFNEALSQSNSFPDYLIQMIKIGEKTGNTEIILKELHLFYEQKEQLTDEIKSFVFYPFIMSVMMLIVLMLIIMKIIPEFMQIYYELGSTVPSATLIIIKAGSIVSKVLVCVMGIVFIFLIIYFIYFKLYNKKLIDIEKYFMKKTNVGKLISKERTAYILSMAFSSGLEIEQSIEMADYFIENEELRNTMKNCKERIVNGESLSETLNEANIFDGLNMGILSAGIKSGKTDEALKTISARYNKYTKKELAKMISSIEPILVISLSLIVGIILIVVMMPLLGIMTSL